MSNNLNRPTLTTNQTQKEVTINDSMARADAAITAEDAALLVFSGAQNLKTLTAEQMRLFVHFIVSGTTSDPNPKVKTANLSRGMVIFTNNLATDLAIEDYGTLLANIIIPAGGTYVIMCSTTGNRAIVRGVDSSFNLAFEPSVLAASTGNLTLSGEQTVDGVALVTGDRILVKNQSTGSQNGVYAVDSGAWSRESASWGEGTAFLVEPGGSTNGGTVWLLTTPPPIIIGTTSLTFAEISTTFFGTFLALTDTPSSYTGHALKLVRVNATEDELEFVEVALTAKSWKDSVRAATTADITLANEQTIDGVSILAGDRVLVKDQTDAEDNGIYDCVSGGAWTRSQDFDVSAEVTSGVRVSVEEGDTYAGQLFYLSTLNPILLDTTELVFTLQAAGGGGGSTAWKDPVRAATTANITIATALNSGDTIDGVTLADGDRVLVKNQSSGAENGIYVVDATPFRSTDCDQDAEVVSGFAVIVQEGTTNADRAYKLTTNGAITVGSTALTFAKFNPTTTIELSDMPSSLSGQALKGLRVNAGETAYEHYTLPSSVISINTQTGSYTLLSADAGVYVRMNITTTANQLTVDTNANQPMSTGTQIPIRQVGTGQTEIVAAVGVTINVPNGKTSFLRAQGSSGLLTKVGTNEWDLTGDLA